MTKKLGPVHIHLVVEDCDDCPFCDADESYTECERSTKENPVRLPIFRRADQVIRPPANCPFRIDYLKRGGEHCFGSFYDTHSGICRECKKAKKCKAEIVKTEES